VHYVGRLQDGTIFDSSRSRGKEFTFTLGKNSIMKRIQSIPDSWQAIHAQARVVLSRAGKRFYQTCVLER
jgi:hypothetical protein